MLLLRIVLLAPGLFSERRIRIILLRMYFGHADESAATLVKVSCSSNRALTINGHMVDANAARSIRRRPEPLGVGVYQQAVQLIKDGCAIVISL